MLGVGPTPSPLTNASDDAPALLSTAAFRLRPVTATGDVPTLESTAAFVARPVNASGDVPTDENAPGTMF